MLRITIDLHVHGNPNNSKRLGVMEIWNDLTGSQTSGNYRFRIFKRGEKAVWKSGDIKSFPRKKLLSWDLLYRCLNSVIADRNKDV